MIRIYWRKKKLDDVIENFQKLPVIFFSTKGDLKGLPGFGNIFINQNTFSSLAIEKDSDIATYIKLGYHESAHYLLQLLKNDCLSQTPPNAINE